MDDFPESILIYGAGVIGCEFSVIFSNYNKCKNIVLFNEGRDRLLPYEDMDISQFLTDNLQSFGKVTVANNVRMKRMEVDYKKKRVKCVFTNGHGEEDVVYVDKVLLASGRVPNVDNLGITDADGKVAVDDHLRCMNCESSNVYLCGDALGKWGLVSVAEMEGRHCVEHMFSGGNPITRLHYEDISSVMFVRPEIRWVTVFVYLQESG